MSQTTIPPATVLEFERFANFVCNLAELDRAEKNSRSYEFQTHLQGLYLDGLDLNLSSGQAQQRAIELFGDPYAIARGFRSNDIKNAFLYENRRFVRLFFFIGSCAYLYTVRPELEHSRFSDFANDYVYHFPIFLAKGFVAVALLYFVVNIKAIGLSAYNEYQVHFVPWFVPKIQTGLPRFHRRWAGVLCSEGHYYRAASSIFEKSLLLLSTVGVAEIAYINRHFFIEYFIVPHAQMIFEMGDGIPGVFPNYPINDFYYFLVSFPMNICAQGIGILAVSAELFDWPEKIRSQSKILSWFFYILPKRLSALFFPRIPEG